MFGGYDDGYRACPCFWGSEPGSLVKLYASLVGRFDGIRVLDAGCGEGKNAYYFGQKSSSVLALDISEYAIQHAKESFGNTSNVTWMVGDIRNMELEEEYYDVIIIYGLLHCLNSEDEIKALLNKLQFATKRSGYNLVCAFNDRYQELDAHPGFHPYLLPHSVYLNLYTDWIIVHGTDTDLLESHPHNQIPHTHSMTRMLAQKPF